ncbi:tetratricopeptide repeat protein [Fervidobacterium thailandense]|uniref:Tetratricopeptide repeat protein n=1 Tax=Fervidobacterium thailandense TaxID=1008305 RepID=A0A1E3G686_9BACT|nr:tetratricopeptide repeat protein [Fervidobacterium thailandense]ODN31128.1 hypothetical protein A4H02_02345 [Fervidobacterium thailandense]
MEILGNEGYLNRDSSVVERFVRLLLSENEVSLARNLLNSLGEEYSHLLLELELKVGNYKRAVEIFNLLPEEKKQNYLHLIEAAEQGAQDVVASLEKVLSNLYNENYPLAYAELQRLKREFPQVVEVIALEIFTALKRGDKKRARSLAEILRKLDRTHPILSKVESKPSLTNLLLPVVAIALLIIVLLNLLVSLNIYWRSPAVSLNKLESEIAVVSRNMQAIRDVLTIVERKLSALEETVSKTQTTANENVADLNVEDKLASILKYLELASEKIDKVLENQRQLSMLSRVEVVRNADTKELERIYAEVSNIASLYRSMNSRIETLLRLTNSLALRLSGERTDPEIRSMLAKLEELSKKLVERLEAFEDPSRLVEKFTEQIENLRGSQADLLSRLEVLRATVEKLGMKVEAIQSAQSTQNPQSWGSAVEPVTVSGVPNVPSVSHMSTVPNAVETTTVRSSETTLDSELRLLSREVRALKKELESISSMVKSSQVGFERIAELESTVKELYQRLLQLDAKATVTLNSGTNTSATSEKAVSDGKSAAADSRQVQAEVRKAIEETKDLRELFILGLRYYSNYFYEASARIFEYLADMLDGIDIYFGEDVYYYLISSHLKLGQVDTAKKYFEKYVEKYPSGDYVKELEMYLKK